MARQSRHTEPLETKAGLLRDYAEINARLSDGEVRGRAWLLSRAEEPFLGRVPTDSEILELHHVMFSDLLAWAGQTRKRDVGPGGQVFVHWTDVPAQLRNLTKDAEYWLPRTEDASFDELGRFLAQFHHRFQWVHPFPDTNGRTGRVLDHYLLWITLGLAGDRQLEHAPVLEYFPSDQHEHAYYEGLRAADRGNLEPLSSYYVDRLEALFGGVSL